MTTLDLMPTMLEAAGLPIPKRAQGHSRLGEIRRRELGWKEPVFIENITQKEVDGKFAIERAVRTPEWKLILRDHPKDELYDLAHDPGERTDLLNRPEQKTRIRELARLILQWGEKSGDPLQMYLSDIFTISCNLAGICGLSLPCGFTRSPKLPIGLQLLGKPFGEETILKIAHAYEQSTDWHKQKPSLMT